MIEIKNLSVSYSKKKSIIDGLNLKFQENCIHGIVGLNGSGKTTLLNTIFGTMKHQEGEIQYQEKQVSKQSIAYLPTVNYFYPHITGREYLNIFQNNDFKLEKWNELFSLPLDKIIETYSTGMKKKLALLGVLKMKKPILILDEPFNGLDIETSRIVRSILLKLKQQNKIIIVTSHIIETLTNMCDYIHHLDNKKIENSVGKTDFQKFENEIYNRIEQKNTALLDKLIGNN